MITLGEEVGERGEGPEKVCPIKSLISWSFKLSCTTNIDLINRIRDRYKKRYEIITLMNNKQINSFSNVLVRDNVYGQSLNKTKGS